MDGSTNNESLMTLHITVLATKTTFSCVIKRDASVDKLNQIINEKEDILCNKKTLIYCSQKIDEDHLLSEYGIEDSNSE